MLTTPAFEQLLDEFGLPEWGRQLITQARQQAQFVRSSRVVATSLHSWPAARWNARLPRKAVPLSTLPR